MYHIKERFEAIKIAKPHYSTYTVFAEAITGTNLTSRVIRKRFYELVDPEDYAENEVKQIFAFLETLTKPSVLKTLPEKVANEGKTLL